MPLDVADRPKPEAHPGEDCQTWYESATSPDRSGHLTVTEYCKCGAIQRSYEDSVL